MAGIVYHNLAKSILLRANQITDALSAAALDALYAGPLSALAGGVEVPLTSLREDILKTEAQIAAMIGNSSNIQLRAALAGEASVSSGDDIPTLDGNSRTFMGKFDGLFDEASDLPLQLMEKDVVLRRIRNSNSFLTLPGRCWCVEGTKVFFSNDDDAYFRGVAWKRSTAETAYDNAEVGTSVMPHQVANLWQNLVLAHIAQENYFVNEAANYSNLAAQDAQAIGLILEPATVGDAVETNRENRNATSENR